MNSKELKIEVTINGETYTQAQLDRYEYERCLHGLHEMKRLGAKIIHNEKELSHIEINWLDPKDAYSVSLEVRKKLGVEGIRELFKDVLADTDNRWKEWNKTPIEEQGVWKTTTEYKITGLKFEDLSKYDVSNDTSAMLTVMPEHYFLQGNHTVGGQIGMEPFGMFGEPTAVNLQANPIIPDFVDFKGEEGFRAMSGTLTLLSDNSPINLSAIHEYKPTEDGFLMKSTFYCPKNAPKAMADGHPIHFAVEVSHGYRDTYNYLYTTVR